MQTGLSSSIDDAWRSPLFYIEDKELDSHQPSPQPIHQPSPQPSPQPIPRNIIPPENVNGESLSPRENSDIYSARMSYPLIRENGNSQKPLKKKQQSGIMSPDRIVCCGLMVVVLILVIMVISQSQRLGAMERRMDFLLLYANK